jgi:hypothetical protein
MKNEEEMQKQVSWNHLLDFYNFYVFLCFSPWNSLNSSCVIYENFALIIFSCRYFVFLYSCLDFLSTPFYSFFPIIFFVLDLCLFFDFLLYAYHLVFFVIFFEDLFVFWLFFIFFIRPFMPFYLIKTKHRNSTKILREIYHCSASISSKARIRNWLACLRNCSAVCLSSNSKYNAILHFSTLKKLSLYFFEKNLIFKFPLTDD